MRKTVLFILLTTFLLPACNLGNEDAVRQAWIISPEEGVSRTHCVDVTETDGTALGTLEATGEALEVLEDPALGSAVCKIDEIGWPIESCFGSGSGDPSWMYYRWDAETESWESGIVAIDTLEVGEGDLLAFVYTTYDPVTFEPIRQPPDIAFEEICPP